MDYIYTDIRRVSRDVACNVSTTQMDRLYDSAIGALIQRFGRVNRKRGKGICDCNIFRQANETDKYIYNPAIVSKTLQALE